MKTFEIQWIFGASTLVQADAFEAAGQWYRFFLGKKEVSKCAKVLVRNIHQLRGIPRTAGLQERGSWELALAAG